jgi:hypothetical protein
MNQWMSPEHKGVLCVLYHPFKNPTFSSRVLGEVLLSIESQLTSGL